MNCREAAKFLYAFADGELDTSENLQVLEHVNMCPECCGKIAIQQQLKGAVAAAFGDEVAPASLHDRIGAAIASAEDAARERPRIIRLWRPMAAAAVVVLAAVGLWSFQGRHTGTESVPVANVQFTDNTPAARTLATHIYETHRKCAAEGKSHQHPELTADGLVAAKEICRKLNYPMLRCGKLDAREDTTFVSANFCGVEDCDGKQHDGGHLIYRFTAGPMEGRAISMMSVTHLGEIKALKKIHVGERDYSIIEPSLSNGQATVVAFDCPKASHLVCLEASPQDTMAFVQNMQPVTVEQAVTSIHPELFFASLER